MLLFLLLLLLLLLSLQLFASTALIILIFLGRKLKPQNLALPGFLEVASAILRPAGQCSQPLTGQLGHVEPKVELGKHVEVEVPRNSWFLAKFPESVRSCANSTSC